MTDTGSRLNRSTQHMPKKRISIEVKRTTAPGSQLPRRRGSELEAAVGGLTGCYCPERSFAY